MLAILRRLNSIRVSRDNPYKTCLQTKRSRKIFFVFSVIFWSSLP